jgi:hypothetical protein
MPRLLTSVCGNKPSITSYNWLRDTDGLYELPRKRETGIMEKKLAQTLKLSAVAVGASLILSSCAPVIFPMADPLGSCGEDNNVSISVSNNRPDVDWFATHVDDDNNPDTPSTNDDTDPTTSDLPDFSLTGEDLTLSLTGSENLEVRYRVGLFDENGLPAVEDDMLLEPYERIVPAPPAFLDNLYGYDSGEMSPLIDFEGVSSVTAAFSEIVLPEYTVGVIDNQEDAAALFGFLSWPGAFLVTCNSGGPDDGEIVAAVQMFPNLLEFEGNPEIELTQSLDDPEMYNSELFLGEEFAGDGVFLLGKDAAGSEVLSADRATNRWLQFYSRIDAQVVETLVYGEPLFVDDAGFINLDSETANFLPDTSYNLILFIIDSATVVSDQDVIQGLYESPIRTAIFDLNINVAGVGEFEAFAVDEQRQPGRSTTPILTDIRDVVEVSTKGNRELKITGSRLNRVLQAKLGTKAAKIVSAEDSILTLKLPSLAKGTYDLTLSYENGEIVKPNFLKYVKSTKLQQISIPSSQKKAAWSVRLANLLTSNSQTTQVDCVARIPAGTKPAPVKKKASAVCSQVSDDSIKTRVFVKKAPAGFAPSVAVKLWD